MGTIRKLKPFYKNYLTGKLQRESLKNSSRKLLGTLCIYTESIYPLVIQNGGYRWVDSNIIRNSYGTNYLVLWDSEEMWFELLSLLSDKKSLKQSSIAGSFTTNRWRSSRKCGKPLRTWNSILMNLLIDEWAMRSW